MEKTRPDIPKLVTLRLPPGLIEQADNLIPSFQSDPHMNLSGQVTRADVLRHAIMCGLVTLEKEGSTRKVRSVRKKASISQVVKKRMIKK